MRAIRDFEDMLTSLERHQVKYLIVGGLAFIYHAKPRYTKDMDLWIEPSDENVRSSGAPACSRPAARTRFPRSRWPPTA